jgi:hypothetical protein
MAHVPRGKHLKPLTVRSQAVQKGVEHRQVGRVTTAMPIAMGNPPVMIVDMYMIVYVYV